MPVFIDNLDFLDFTLGDLSMITATWPFNGDVTDNP